MYFVGFNVKKGVKDFLQVSLFYEQYFLKEQYWINEKWILAYYWI